jgi:hypothetical protein
MATSDEVGDSLLDCDGDELALRDGLALRDNDEIHSSTQRRQCLATAIHSSTAIRNDRFTPDGSDSESKVLLIRSDTHIIVRLYRCDSDNLLRLQYTGTICLVNPLTCTESCNTYLVSYVTNIYG